MNLNEQMGQLGQLGQRQTWTRITTAVNRNGAAIDARERRVWSCCAPMSLHADSTFLRWTGLCNLIPQLKQGSVGHKFGHAILLLFCLFSHLLHHLNVLFVPGICPSCWSNGAFGWTGSGTVVPSSIRTRVSVDSVGLVVCSCFSVVLALDVG